MKQVNCYRTNCQRSSESALAQLQTTEDRTDIAIIDEGKKGLFGIFGSSPAIVKVTVKVDPIEEALKFLSEVSEKMGVNVTIETEKNGKQVKFKLSGEKIALLHWKKRTNFKCTSIFDTIGH